MKRDVLSCTPNPIHNRHNKLTNLGLNSQNILGQFCDNFTTFCTHTPMC